MKSYLSLSKFQAKLHRKQNRMTCFCIALAVILITGVFSMVDFEYAHMYNKLVKDHGNWHIAIANIPMDEARNAINQLDVKSSCVYSSVNYHLDMDFKINSGDLILIGTDEGISDIYGDIISRGSFPKDSSSIALTENAMDRFGYKIGDKVTIHTPSQDLTYTITASLATTSQILADDSYGAILPYEELNRILDANSIPRSEALLVLFKSTRHAQKTINYLRETYGWDSNNISENSAILGITGESSNNYIAGLYGVAIFLVCLVIFAGVLMIAGSMNTSIEKRTQYFGMLRCIGASKKQIKNIVIVEALNWCLLSVPLGLLIATIAVNIICGVLKYVIGGEWEGMPFGKVSLIGIALGSILGIITVLLAALAPARRASKTSPVSAVAGISSSQISNKAINKKRIIKVDSEIGINHAIGIKKNLVLMTGSFALSIILFLLFSILTLWVNNALTTTKPYSPDLSVYYSDYDSSINPDLVDTVYSIPGVKNVYGRMHAVIDIESDKAPTRADLISYESLQFDWAKKDIIKGQLDNVINSEGILIIYEKNNPFIVGDTIKINGKTYSLDAMVSDTPFSESDIPTLLVSEDTFKKITGIDKYAVLDIQVEKNAPSDTPEQIRKVIPDNILLSNRIESNKEVNSTYYAFCILVYGFLGLIALITIFNIMNSISMSVSSHYKQYGIMRAVGMDKTQLRKVIMAEALTYTFSGISAGLIIGIPLHKIIFKAIITNYWGIPWSIPYLQLSIILIVVLISAFVSVYGPSKQLENSSVVEILA